jgi:hypothetical protein
MPRQVIGKAFCSLFSPRLPNICTVESDNRGYTDDLTVRCVRARFVEARIRT